MLTSFWRKCYVILRRTDKASCYSGEIAHNVPMVDFSEISPHLHVKISPKAKRLALRLDGRARRVNLVIPARASLKKAYEFAELNQGWIADKISALPAPVPFVEGSVIPVFGTNRTVRIYESTSRVTAIELTESELRVTTRLEDPAPRIGRFLRAMASEELGKLAHGKAASLNKKLKTFTVRDMKSRWGSCSIDGRMSLSWRLIFAPPEAIDYVVSHEAAHLVHDNHGKSFWDLCQTLSLDFAAGHDWMRQHGITLGRYGERT